MTCDSNISLAQTFYNVSPMANPSVQPPDNSYYRVAFDLMEHIGNREPNTTEKTNRKYWLTLYRQCFDVVFNRQTAEEAMAAEQQNKVVR